jgi:tetratricopeptide (TPR) repeat protein
MSVVETIDYYKDELTKARQNDSSERLIVALADYGNAILKTGDAPQALTHIEEALRLAKSIDEKINQARLLGLKGTALKQIGNPQTAQNAFNKSLKLARKLDHKPIMIDALTQLGRLKVEIGEMEKGIPDLELAFRTALEIQDAPRIMYIAGLMAGVFMLSEQYGKAMELYAIALEHAENLEKLEAQSNYHLSIGNIYLLKKDFNPAEEHMKKALDIGSRLGNPRIQFSSFEQLLRHAIICDKLYEAQFSGQQAVRLAKDLKDIGAAVMVLRQLGEYLLEKEAYADALPLLEDGYALCQEMHDQEQQMYFLKDQGMCHYLTGALDTAEEKLKSALDIGHFLHLPDQEAAIASRLSAIKADQGHLDQALSYGQRALELAKNHKLTFLEGELHVMQGLNMHENGQAETAVKHLKSALAIFSQFGRKDLQEQVQSYLNELEISD